jgi:endonuclease VIII
MPEGDTLFRIAAALGPPLEGKPVVALEVPRSGRRYDHLTGRRVERVEARGKHLLIFFDEGSVLHTHLRMTGAWHLYREGDRWRRSIGSASAILAVPGYVAVCFRAPVARVLRASALPRDGLVGALGPDLLGEEFDTAEALHRLRALDNELFVKRRELLDHLTALPLVCDRRERTLDAPEYARTIASVVGRAAAR